MSGYPCMTERVFSVHKLPKQNERPRQSVRMSLGDVYCSFIQDL